MERRRIGILSRGLWAIRDDVARLTGFEPVWAGPPFGRAVDAYAGWGHKPTAVRARRAAGRRGVPYVAIEDGFLRGLRPGPATRALSYVTDGTGIYYDSRTPSDLETLILRSEGFEEALLARARRGIAMLRAARLSKYNHAPLWPLDELIPDAGARRLVLVLDQALGDASVEGAQASAATFPAMIAAAVAENEDALILVKAHPDNRRRGGAGHLDASAGRVVLLEEAFNPWPLLEACARVYTVSSLLGFEALMAGAAVTCFGLPFYAGWGLTDDRLEAPRRGAARSLEQVFAAAYLRYAQYLDPYTRAPIAFEQAVEALTFLRDRFMENRPRVLTVGFSPWKQRAVAPFLDGPDGPALNLPDLAAAATHAAREGGQIAVWGASDDPPRTGGRPLLRLEDGLIRSAGLGAAFVMPSSLVVDSDGLYFDARAPSRFEAIASSHAFDDEMLARAKRLRERIVAAGVSKYNVGQQGADLPDARGRLRVLVPGQVEDDASIRYGSPRIRRNLDLLREARRANPDAFILYKPHPDVHHGLRNGRILPEQAAELADAVVPEASITALIGWCDRLETMTSLSGFEALLRGRHVVVHGLPFYAGWGLTEDRLEAPRRERRLTLDMLVAAALILYPRYVDPLVRIPCTPEHAVERIAAMSGTLTRPSLAARAKRFAGMRFGRMKHLLLR